MDALTVVKTQTGVNNENMVQPPQFIPCEPALTGMVDTDLELYQAEGCPYCKAVRAFCSSNGISLTLHTPRTPGSMVTQGRVVDEDDHETLEAHGKDQIPLLIDEERDEALYESDDIIAYLEKHYVDGEPIHPPANNTKTKQFATGVVLFIGVAATVGHVAGLQLITDALAYLGVVAIVALNLVYARAFLERFRAA